MEPKMSISPPLTISHGPRGWTWFDRADRSPYPALSCNPEGCGRERSISLGCIFLGQWEVLKELGAGGMGRVYKVFSRVERRNYAMKVLEESFAKDPAALARFEHEFCTLKRLSHAHIVKADSFVAAKGEDPCFYTMEFLEGEPLDKIAKEGPLPVERAVQIALQICDAVAALHEIGVLHRDIKPANIIVGRKDGRDHATLVDLGVCKWTSRYYAELDGRTPPDLRRETEAGIVLGTPGYKGASEDDEDAEFRDVFGLGATLFRILTRRMPYAGEPDLDEAIQWGADEDRLPGTLREALEGALQASTSRRYQTIAEFRDALELVVDELAGPPAEKAPVIQPVRRSRALIFGGGIVIGIGIGIATAIGLGLGAGGDGGARSSGVNQPGASVIEERSSITDDAADERGADERGADGPGADGPGADERGADERGADGRGADGPDSDGPDSDGRDADDRDADGRGAELRLGTAANCVPPNSGGTFVDLQIDEDGRLAGVHPGAGVDVLTVICLKRKLGGTRLWPGGQSTHRIRLSSLLAEQGGEPEHDDQ